MELSILPSNRSGSLFFLHTSPIGHSALSIMSGIAERFEQLRGRRECALIPFLTGGFPSPDKTLGLMQALERGGCDIIELGVPFSDPIADGPTIQRSSAAALRAGASLKLLLAVVREFRSNSKVPVVLFGAYNPFFHYGVEKFCKDAADCGADGVLIPDLPVEEAAEVAPLAKAAGLDLIRLVAPTTPLDRKAQICADASGFIYYISVKGVTGARSTMELDLSQPLGEIRSITKLPVAVGFGISTPEQAARVAQQADAAVVGSALIDFIDKNSSDPELNNKVTDYMAAFKSAMTTSSAFPQGSNK